MTYTPKGMNTISIRMSDLIAMGEFTANAYSSETDYFKHILIEVEECADVIRLVATNRRMLGSLERTDKCSKKNTANPGTHRLKINLNSLWRSGVLSRDERDHKRLVVFTWPGTPEKVTSALPITLPVKCDTPAFTFECGVADNGDPQFYIDYRRVFMKHPEVGIPLTHTSLNPKLLAKYASAAKLLGTVTELNILFSGSQSDACYVYFGNEPAFLGALMPMFSEPHERRANVQYMRLVKAWEKEALATRSRIGIQMPDGHFKSIYCHYDGNPDGVGRTLAEHYTDPAKVSALIDLGNLNMLGTEIGEQHDFNRRLTNLGDTSRSPAIEDSYCLAYGRDQGESEEETKAVISFTKMEFNIRSQHDGAKFSYLFNGEKWKCTRY